MTFGAVFYQDFVPTKVTWAILVYILSNQTKVAHNNYQQ